MFTILLPISLFLLQLNQVIINANPLILGRFTTIADSAPPGAAAAVRTVMTTTVTAYYLLKADAPKGIIFTDSFGPDIFRLCPLLFQLD